MSSSFLILLSATLLAFILTVESVNQLYSYDDGNGGDEHCCVARIGRNYCLAAPLTRSLIQVNQQCHRFSGSKSRRSGGKKKGDPLADKIVRRLNVKSSEAVGDKLLFELKTPLETTMLQKDLVCLTSKQRNMNFDKCYLELADDAHKKIDNHDDDDDADEDEVPRRRHKHREHRRRHSGSRKRTADVSSEEDDRVIDDDTPVVTDHGEKETRRSELHQKVHIREGRGFSIRQTYTLNLTRIRETLSEDDRCLAWYRKQTRKIRRNTSKDKKFCRSLNDHLQTCVSHLVFGDTETSQHAHNTIVSLATGSKLYCEDQAGDAKLLGVHRHGVVCLQTDNEIIIEQKFSDIAGLSDGEKNQEVFRFIEDHPKFQAEFGHDCHGTHALPEVDAHDNEERASAKHHVSKRV